MQHRYLTKKMEKVEKPKNGQYLMTLDSQKPHHVDVQMEERAQA